MRLLVVFLKTTVRIVVGLIVAAGVFVAVLVTESGASPRFAFREASYVALGWGWRWRWEEEDA